MAGQSLGAAGIAKVAFGASEVKKISRGDVLVWQAITLTPLGMAKAGSFDGGGFNSTNHVTGWAPESGTPPEQIVGDELIVNGNGNITVTLSMTRSSTSGTASTFQLFRNGVQVATSASLSFDTTGTCSWTGDVVVGDRFRAIWYKNTANAQSITAGFLRYVVNSAQ
ncbi:hypothetical protein ACLBYD_29070 [Rhodococcus sp. C26F]